MRRLLAVLVVAAVPVAARAQEPADHPFKNVKVGDYANYTMTSKVGTFDAKGTITNTVKAVSATEVTIEMTGTMKGMPVPTQTQKIDLTKAFEPAVVGGGVPVAKSDAKTEKVGEGTEKITVGGKSYESRWVKMRVTTKTQAGDVTMDLKTWVGKDIPLGLGKMEMTSQLAGMTMSMTMELTDSGRK
ncbi:MAG TPA: hypothetical protein VD866_30705 [Urbifossiella sp.]|nr:hypothetical protein [Urbifossiella sp.]